MLAVSTWLAKNQYTFVRKQQYCLTRYYARIAMLCKRTLDSKVLYVFCAIFYIMVNSVKTELPESNDGVSHANKDILSKAFASQISLIESQSIGCLFDKGVCTSFEQCLDDDLFGTCVAKYADNLYFKYRIPRQLLRELKLIMRSLVEQNYTWHDLFTQCCIRAALVSSSMEMSTDLSVCYKFATKGLIKLDLQPQSSKPPLPPIDDGLGGHGGKKRVGLGAAGVADFETHSGLDAVAQSTFDELKSDSAVQATSSSSLAQAIRTILFDDASKQKETSYSAEPNNWKSTAADPFHRIQAARSKESAMTSDGQDNKRSASSLFVDGRFLWIQFSRPERISSADMLAFINEFNNQLGRPLLEQHFNIDENRNEASFRLTAEAAPGELKAKLDKLKFNLETSGSKTFTWTRFGFGWKNRVSVSELSSNWSERTRVTSTLLVCAVVIAMILALFVLFIVQRLRSSKSKLADLTSSTKLVARGDSSDYKDLCRQRMAESGKVKPAAGGSASSSAGSWSDDPINTDMDITTGHLILSYMENYLNNKEQLEHEWADLCSYEAEQSASLIGASPENAAKNRYQDLLPYDHSRVALSREQNASGGDYINASYIYDSDPKAKAYILTQGPMESTIADFWQMLWESGSVTVVNLTGLGGGDSGPELCAQYWPAEGSKLYGQFEVHLVSEHVWSEDFVVRNFYLKNLSIGEARTVTMFHFFTWEEAGLPRSAKALLDFRRKVNKSYKGRAAPLVIHCSDGCGRSGTYCLLDLALCRIAKGVKQIDLAASLEHLRDQRPGLVKTRDQFEFVVSAIAEEVHNVLKTLPQ